MSKDSVHPEDFSPYLDRATSDPRYDEIVHHLNDCALCQGEVRTWQSLDDLFRSQEAEIEVPPYQWRRIAEQIPQPAQAGVFVQIRSLLQPWRLGWNVTLATILLGAMIFTGLEYRRGFEEKQLLLAITRYAAEEGQRIRGEKNPFQPAAVAENNPFAPSPLAGEGKASADRR